MNARGRAITKAINDAICIFGIKTFIAIPNARATTKKNHALIIKAALNLVNKNKIVIARTKAKIIE